MSFFISKNTWRSRRRTHQTQAHQTCGKADGNVDKDIIFYHDLVWICFWQWHYFQWWSYLDLLVFVKVSHNRSQLICVHEEAHHVQDSAFSDQESKKYPLHFPHIKGRVAPPYQLSQGWWLLFSRRQRRQRRSYCQSGWEKFIDPPEDAKLLLVKPGLKKDV